MALPSSPVAPSMMGGALSVLLVLAAACNDAPAARPLIGEERDGLWLREEGEPPRRVTALQVDGYDYDSLAARQREGVVILYWAAAPVIAPDGRRVAYVTNREAVAHGTSGQSIWLLDLRDGSERPLLSRERRSYRAVAWLGDDVVYFGDEPGVWAIDAGSGVPRRLASGTWIAGRQDGNAIAVAEGAPDDVSIRVITRRETIDVPAPPAPFGWLMDGRFDDAGRLHLTMAADSGVTRRGALFDVDARRLRIEPARDARSAP